MLRPQQQQQHLQLPLTRRYGAIEESSEKESSSKFWVRRAAVGLFFLATAFCVLGRPQRNLFPTGGATTKESLVFEDSKEESSSKEVEDSRTKFCVAHGAYGENYKSIAALSARTKAKYADLHGYRFVEFIGDTLDDFVDKYCPELAGQIKYAYSATTPVKSCGIWASLRDSCDYVLWTDADAIIVDSSITMEHLLFMDDDEADDDLVRSKDVLFFLESYADLGLCPDLTSPERQLPKGSCGLPDEFGNCVNTGAVIMRSGDFTETLLREQLAMAVFDNDFLTNSPCSTNDLGTGFAKNLTWDQCMFTGETEQCTLSCLYRQNPKFLENTACQISNDNQTHYLFGTLLSPPIEAVISYLDTLKDDTPPEKIVIPKNLQFNTTDDYLDYLRSIGPPHPYEGTFVYNCMGGDFFQKMNCVAMATYWLWPEMIPTDTYAPRRDANVPHNYLPTVPIEPKQAKWDATTWMLPPRGNFVPTSSLDKGKTAGQSSENKLPIAAGAPQTTQFPPAPTQKINPQAPAAVATQPQQDNKYPQQQYYPGLAAAAAGGRFTQ